VPPRRTLNHSDSMYGALVAGVVVVLVRVEGVKEGGQGGPMTASIGSRHRAPRRLRWSLHVKYLLHPFCPKYTLSLTMLRGQVSEY